MVSRVICTGVLIQMRTAKGIYLMKNLVFAFIVATICSAGMSGQVVHAADIAGYLEYKKKLDAQERASKGLETIEARAFDGDSQAQYELGMTYRYEWANVDKSDREAALWFREAADAGHAEAQFELGLMYEFGEGVPLNLRRAQKLYQQAARQDLREARTSLALLKGKMLKVEQYIRNHHKPYYGKDKQE